MNPACQTAGFSFRGARMTDDREKAEANERPQRFTPALWLLSAFAHGAIIFPLGFFSLIISIALPIPLLALVSFAFQFARFNTILTRARSGPPTPTTRKSLSQAWWNVLMIVALVAGGIASWPIWLEFFQSLNLGAALA